MNLPKQLKDLTAENDQLRAAIQELTESRDKWANRAAEYREDAARYQWLVTQSHPSISLSWSGPEEGQGYSLTQVIDHAMKETP